MPLFLKENCSNYFFESSFIIFTSMHFIFQQFLGKHFWSCIGWLHVCTFLLQFINSLQMFHLSRQLLTIVTFAGCITWLTSRFCQFALHMMTLFHLCMLYIYIGFGSSNHNQRTTWHSCIPDHCHGRLLYHRIVVAALNYIVIRTTWQATVLSKAYAQWIELFSI